MSINICIWRHKLYNAKTCVGPTFTWSNEPWYSVKSLFVPSSGLTWIWWSCGQIESRTGGRGTKQWNQLAKAPCGSPSPLPQDTESHQFYQGGPWCCSRSSPQPFINMRIIMMIMHTFDNNVDVLLGLYWYLKQVFWCWWYCWWYW